MNQKSFKKKYSFWDFPDGPVVKTPCSQDPGHGFNPWWGAKVLHAVQHDQKKKGCPLTH